MTFDTAYHCTRFAPSPTGFLHLGHAYAAQQAFNYGMPCLLRIEDIDHKRCRPHFTEAIFEDLTWLGFHWPANVRIQSQYKKDYAKVIESLASRNLIYRCFKTRREIQAEIMPPETVYRGPLSPLSLDEQHSRIAQGESFAWRLSMTGAREYLGNDFNTLRFIETGHEDSESPGERLVNLMQFGDEILARKDIGTSYHIAACHDDWAQNITTVVRGVDLAPLTHFHRLLQALMDWPEPHYHHHRLLMDDTQNHKLSKRNKDTTIRDLRAAGHTAEAVLDMANQHLSR